MTILYFTSTGNSLHVAKEIGGTLLSIPQMIKENRYDFEDDVVGVIFPVYSFRVPKIVLDFLQKANIKANYTFAISTYGNIAGPTLINLEKKLKKSELKFNYMNQIIMIDNYLPMFDITKQIEDVESKKIDENLRKIISDIQCKKEQSPTGSLLLSNTIKILEPVFDAFENGNTPKRFTINDKCTLCGTCAKVCPTKNIEVSDKVNYFSNCISCLGCIHNCPFNAIHIKGEKSDTRFRNENVTLKEIEIANNQM